MHLNNEPKRKYKISLHFNELANWSFITSLNHKVFDEFNIFMKHTIYHTVYCPELHLDLISSKEFLL